MKKSFFALILFSLFCAFAELQAPKRFFELGFDFSGGASENLFKITDALKEHLILDMDVLYSNVGKKGPVFSFETNAEAYLNFNFFKFGFGLHGGIDVSAWMGFSRDLFGLLSEGLNFDNVSIDLDFWVQTFAHVSAPFYFRVKLLKVKVTPTFFVPLVYVPHEPGKIKIANSASGGLNVSANVPFSVYTIQKLSNVSDGENFSLNFPSGLNMSDMLSQIGSSGGFDIDIEAEYPYNRKFDIGGYFHMPIVPGKLRHKVYAMFNAHINVPSIMNLIDNADVDIDVEFESAKYSQAKYKVNRPFRMGGMIAFRPAGKWLTLRAAFGFGVRNPFGSDVNKKSAYPEYELGVDFLLAYVFGLNFHTEYKQKIYAHSFKFLFNTRILEIDLGVALQNPTFKQSFHLAGARAMLGVKMGF